MFFRSLGIVSLGTVVSRLLGFIREVALSHFYGTSLLSDMFILSIRLPALIRGLIESGMLQATVIPMYGQIVANQNKSGSVDGSLPQQEARIYSGGILFYVLIGTASLVIACEFAMPQILGALAPGFSIDPATTKEFSFLARLSFPYLLFLCCAGVFSCILTTHRHFLSSSLAPAVSNAILIVALVVFSERYPGSVLYLVIAFLITGFSHLAIVCSETWGRQLWPIFSNLKFTPRIRTTFKNCMPTALTSSVHSINTLVATFLASILPFGSLSMLNYTERLFSLPIGVIGISLYVVLIPSYSRIKRNRTGATVSEQEHLDSFAKLQKNAVTVAMVFSLPCALAFFFLADPIVTAVYVRGAFSPESGEIVSRLLQISSFSLSVLVLTPPLLAYFHSEQRYKLLLIFALLTVTINAFVAIMTIDLLQHQGIVLASVLSGWLHFLLLFAFLPRFLRRNFLRTVAVTVLRLLPALIILGVTCYYINGWLIQYSGFTLLAYLGAFACLMVVLFLVFAFRICKIPLHR